MGRGADRAHPECLHRPDCLDAVALPPGGERSLTMLVTASFDGSR